MSENSVSLADNIDFTPLLCVICQKNGGHLAPATGKGILGLKKAAESRKKKYDETYREAITRIESISYDSSEGVPVPVVKLHANCRATFNSHAHISRLPDAVPIFDLQSSTNESNDAVVTSTDWTECIFCQESKKDRPRKLQDPQVEATIKSIGQIDAELNIRIARGSINLIQKGTLYHNNCLTKNQRILEKSKLPKKSEHFLALSKLISELRSAGNQGKVLKLSSVWDRFIKLSEEFGETIPQSFQSRLSTFKEKLSTKISDVYQFYQPLDRDIHERQMMLIPIKFQCKIIANKALDEENNLLTTFAHETEDINRSLIHSALQVHSDLKNMDGHKGFNVSLESAKAIIPKRLQLFLTVATRGQDGLEDILNENSYSEEIDDSDDEEEDGDDEDDWRWYRSDSKETPSGLDLKILSIGQDIVYAASHGKKLTPKHIGLALTLHQKTKDRKLVTLFNKAGHSMTYRQLLQVDTSLAGVTLDSLNYTTGAVVPHNLVPYRPINTTGDSSDTGQPPSCPFLLVTADNIDKQMDTLDGKKSFHATQMVVFQREGKSIDDILDSLKVTQKLSLEVPEIMRKIFEPDVPPRDEPVLKTGADLKWYKPSNEKSDSVIDAEAKDLAFLISRNYDEEKMGWTEYNKIISTKDPAITASGFMPLILSPAHEYNTLITVLMRCVTLADELHYPYIVLTVDQALHCKLKELIWSSEIFQKRIILRMGGLHISMNFLRAIGQHMTNSGLSDIWIESGVLGVGSVTKVLEGKAYSKGMRVHKLTYQALWRILTPRFLEYLDEFHEDKSQKLQDALKNNSDLTDFLKVEDQRNIVTDFLKRESKRSPTSEFWIIYMNMVSTLLKFTRSLRDGEFDLYVDGMVEMLPTIARYDHYKYVASLVTYIYDMHNLPEEVLDAFKRGEFVVKKSKSKFNQVDPDHAQEWLVGTCKSAGGIAKFTNKENTMQKWILSYHWRTEISQKTYSMFGIEPFSSQITKGRIKRDQNDEDAIYKVLNELGVLTTESPSEFLQNVATKDLATEEIQQSLLNVFENGTKQVTEFVKNRMTLGEDGKPAVSFVAPQNKVMAPTFANLEKKDKTKSTQRRIDTNEKLLLQRLVMAYESGRPVDLIGGLKHELQEIPLSLAETNGELRSGDELCLMTELSKGIPYSLVISNNNESHLIIDAETILSFIGNPKNVQTFGDYGGLFAQEVKYLALLYKRIDLLFSQYKNKLLTRNNSASTVRRVIENGRVPLPKNWKNFLLNIENRADLARFLSGFICKQNIEDADIVVSGATDDLNVFSNNNSIDTKPLKTSHESVATRIILHALSSAATTIVVSTSDANAGILAVRFFNQMTCKELWIETVKSKKKQYIPIHKIADSMSMDQKLNLLAYHALTGCELTSYLKGITKAGGWDTYKDHYELLTDFRVDLFNAGRAAAEMFVLKLYKVDQGVQTADLARYVLFRKLKKLDKLPPTSDALELHMKRAFYQLSIWENSSLGISTTLVPTEYGWIMTEGGDYVPLLMILEPIPQGFLNVIFCGCKTQCSTLNCKCRKNNIPCTELCACVAPCKNANHVACKKY